METYYKWRCTYKAVSTKIVLSFVKSKREVVKQLAYKLLQYKVLASCYK